MRKGLGFHNRHSAGGFNPASLFAGGTVQGAWYDPSDLTTLFQDSAGTTPVTAVEQPVGLMLDKSKGLVLGSELVNLASLPTPTISNSGGSVGAWDAPTRTMSNTATGTNPQFPRFAFNFGLVTNTIYRVQGRLTGDLSALDSVRLATGGTANNITYSSTTGIFSADFRAANGNSIEFLVRGNLTAPQFLTIAELSIRQVTGNHAYQSTSASRPTLRARYNLLTRSEEFSNAAYNNSSGVTFTGSVAAFSSTAFRYQNVTGVPNLNGTTYTARVRLSSPTGKATILFRMANGSSGADSVSQLINLTASPTVYTITRTFTASGSSIDVGLDNRAAVGGDGIAGDVVATEFQLVSTAVFPSNVYQRVGAATDYATGAAFPPYLAFDGTDDSMLTNSVDFATVTSDGQARRNLLSVPTLFNDTTGWATARAAIAVSTAVSPPAGISNLFKLTEDTTASNTHQFLSFSDTTVVNGTRYVSSIYARAAERSWIALQEGQGVTATAYFDLATGAIGTISGTGSPTASIENIGSGWYRCSVSWVASGTAARVRVYLATGDNGAVYTGDGTSGAYLSAAQLETGSTATAFQNIGTDQMTVFAGVTKNSDAAVGTLVELSAASSTNNGSFGMFAPGAAAAQQYYLLLRSTVTNDRNAITYPSPITNVVTQICDIAGVTISDELQARVNGVLVGTNSGGAGTGNFGNYPIFIGRRNNATVPFNGNIYSLVIAGALYSAGQVSSTEQWVAAKTPLGSI